MTLYKQFQKEVCSKCNENLFCDAAYSSICHERIKWLEKYNEKQQQQISRLHDMILEYAKEKMNNKNVLNYDAMVKKLEKHKIFVEKTNKKE